MFLVILGVALWILFAFAPAIMAKNKGYNFWLFLVLSWFISFVITLIVVLFLKDKTKTASDRAADTAAERALEKEYEANS